MPPNEIKEQLIDIAIGRKNDYVIDWMHYTEVKKKDYHSHMEVEFFPEDSKTVDEVTSFKISTDISGIEVTTFERQE